RDEREGERETERYRERERERENGPLLLLCKGQQMQMAVLTSPALPATLLSVLHHLRTHSIIPANQSHTDARTHTHIHTHTHTHTYTHTHTHTHTLTHTH